MDAASGIYMPLSDNSQSPLSSVPPSPLLPPNRHPDGYLNELNSNMDYLNDELNSDAIKALLPSSDEPSSPTYN